jgi:voltage-dependent potassium channel beta subunit
MQYRRLGRSGLRISALSFGAWITFGTTVGRKEARELMACAYEHGVNFFDNAEVYAQGRAEQIMGEALADLRWRRDSFCVSSKVFWGAVENPRPTQHGLSRKHVFDACHEALRRLRVDYLDLYFCHRHDPETPVGETVAAMDALVRQGKVMYWGTSEWPAARIEEAQRFARENGLTAPTMEQPEYNLIHRERVEKEYAPLFRDYGMGATTWSPLASGLLTGKYNDGVPADSRLKTPGYAWVARWMFGREGEARLARVRRFCALAEELDVTPAQLAIAWCLRNPDVSSVILGASRLVQLESNLKVLDLLERLDGEVMPRVEACFADAPSIKKGATAAAPGGEAVAVIDSPVGRLRLRASGEGLTAIEFAARARMAAPSGGDAPAQALLARAVGQLEEYFAGRRRSFDLPLAPAGTAFQRRCWQALAAIPYGETRSYADIAAAIGQPKALRAVGLANHRNPLPIVVPCHRVIGADGSLTGYGGGLEAKRRLLALEQGEGR